MTVTEITVFNLKKAYTNEELASDKVHQKSLETVKAAKGCKGVIWSVFDDDPKALAWLVEWNTIEDHIDTFQTSSVYKGFVEDLKTFMSDVRSLVHYPLDPPPSKVLSKEAPTLELLQFTLKEAVTFDQNYEACKPITDGWKKDGTKFTTSPNMDEGATDLCVFVIAWKSKEEHLETMKKEYYAKALKAAQPMWNVETYTHLNPIL